MIPRNLRPFWGANKKIICSTILCKNTQHSLFPQCKTSIGNNCSSIKDREVEFAYTRVLRPLRIEWCDRHFCHVTWSDHAHRFGVNQHLASLTPCNSGSIQARTVENGLENVFRHRLHQFCVTNEDLLSVP